MLNAGWDLRRETSPSIQQHRRVAFGSLGTHNLTRPRLNFPSRHHGRLQLSKGGRNLAQRFITVLERAPRRVEFKPQVISFVHQGGKLRTRERPTACYVNVTPHPALANWAA